jgi:tight adherence protein C
MIAALMLGGGFGLGLWALLVWLLPPRPALGVALARRTMATAPPIPETDQLGWPRRLGQPFIAPLQAIGLPDRRLEPDLAVIERPASVHLADKAVLALAGLLAPALAECVLAIGGLQIGITLPVVAGLILAAIGFLIPDIRARSEATQRRNEFRHALSAYLDLVWITLAGGAGVDSALGDAARIGHGWAFDMLRRALMTARLARTTPWATLRQLGEKLDIPDLTELAASVSLAGTEGAKVRASLASKSTTLRTHQLTAAETDAQAASERMSLPVMLLFLGFLVFIGYPALTQVLNGL